MTELELRAHKLEAYSEIENVMSRHTYYHAMCFNREELENCWSQERGPEVVWSQNFGRWIGLDKLMPLYAGDNKYTDGDWLKERIIAARPEIKDKIEAADGRSLSETPIHCLASPVIEISGDGMSAKGVWYTPGFALRHDFINDNDNVSWMWEKYGADFVYENGEWRFLRLLICMDMTAGGDNGDWTKPKMPMGPPPDGDAPGGDGPPQGGGGPGGPGGPGDGGPPQDDPDDPDGKRGKSPAMGGGVSVPADEPGRFKDYSPTRVPVEVPKLPEPFESLDKTFSY